MKSLLVLLLGSLPLAILTAHSFLELRRASEAPAAYDRSFDPASDAAAVKELPSQVKAAKPLADELAGTDLLASESLSGLKNLQTGSSLDALKDSWNAWHNARQLVGRSASVPPPSETAGADQLQEQLRTLGQLKAEYEKARPPGSEAVVSLLDQRIEAIRRHLGRAATEREADSALAKARDEFQPTRYGRCAALCDQWLAQYSGLDPAVTAKMRVLGDRAQFLNAYEQMRAQFRTADSLAGQQATIVNFLAKYSDRASPTPKERQLLEQCRGALAQLQSRLQANAISRQAADAIRELVAQPPPGIAERLQAAAQLRAKYPTEAVAQSLRTAARHWIAQLVPEKTLAEQSGLLEAETRQGQILRGFFRKTTGPDGSLIGYQYFANYQQYRDPTAQVGTYSKDDLLAAPGVSVPQQCLGQYRQHRDELLSQPGRRAAWESLAAACEQCDARLVEHRKKAGSSSPPLSFQAEARSARDVLSPPVWSHVEKIFGE